MSKAFEVERIQPHYMAVEWDGEYSTIKEIEALSDHAYNQVEFGTDYSGNLLATIPHPFDHSSTKTETVSVGGFVVYDSHKEEYSFHDTHYGYFERVFRKVEKKP